MTATAGLFERQGSVRALAVMRILLGPVTLLHLAPFLREARAGIHYDDHFWVPYTTWAPRPPGELWAAALWLGAAAAVCMGLGILTRLATTTTFAVVAGHLLLSQTHFRHNRTFLAILLLALALVPAGRVLSVDAWWRRRRGRPPRPDLAPVWPLTMVRVQVSLVYLASGVSKLVDPDWLGGLVLWDRVVRYRYVFDGTPVPGWAVDLLTWRPFHLALAPAAVATELFIGIGLWSPRTRLAALRLAIAFHVMIEISARVEVFSLAALAATCVWVTASTRDRTLRVRTDTRAGRLLWAAVPRLDWFARFRVERAGPGAAALEAVDRDGTVHRGRDGLRLVLARLPVTFLLAGLVGRCKHRPATGAGAPGRTAMSRQAKSHEHRRPRPDRPAEPVLVGTP